MCNCVKNKSRSRNDEVRTASKAQRRTLIGKRSAGVNAVRKSAIAKKRKVF